MSIRQRLDDVKFLYTHGRKDGAFLSLMTAVSATSRKRYPKEGGKNDRDAFTSYLRDELIVITSGAVTKEFKNYIPTADTGYYPDMLVPFEDILYEYVRCNLSHEATLAREVEFCEPRGSGWNLDTTSGVIKMSEDFMYYVFRAVKFSPENFDQFPEVKDIPDDVVAWECFGNRRDDDSVSEYMRTRNQRKHG